MNVTLIAAVSLCFASLHTSSSAAGEGAARAPEKSDARPAGKPGLDPVLEKLSSLVGGTWVSVPRDPQKPFLIEYRYEMAFGGRAVRATGLIGKGSPNAVATEAFFGWDPAKKCVYYIDFHGAETVYKGTIRAVGEGLETEFETIVGAPGQFRSRDEFPDEDTSITTIFGKKGDEWVKLHTITLKRQPS